MFVRVVTENVLQLEVAVHEPDVVCVQIRQRLLGNAAAMRYCVSLGGNQRAGRDTHKELFGQCPRFVFW